jgi:hypothetical protein
MEAASASIRLGSVDAIAIGKAAVLHRYFSQGALDAKYEPGCIVLRDSQRCRRVVAEAMVVPNTRIAVGGVIQGLLRHLKQSEQNRAETIVAVYPRLFEDAELLEERSLTRTAYRTIVRPWLNGIIHGNLLF